MEERKVCPFMSTGKEMITWYSGETREITGSVQCLEDKCMAWDMVHIDDNEYRLGCRLIYGKNV